MTRANILWGLGGAVIGAIATYFVMEYIYEKELAEWEGGQDEESFNALNDANDSLRKVVEITDAEMYTVIPVEAAYEKAMNAANRFNPAVNDGQDEFDPNLPVESIEEHMEEDEELVMQALYENDHSESNEDDTLQDEEDQDEEEGEDVPIVDAWTGIYIIEVAEVQPGRRIVARFNHDTCNVEVSKVMSVKTTMFDEVIEEQFLEELLGLEAENILMNAEPSKQERMLAVRNNLINLDFAISY
jgi:hypothetical protein